MEPECDAAALFRTVNGQCNNLNSDRSLWGSMTISMRRELPVINDLYQIGTYADLLTTSRQGNLFLTNGVRKIKTIQISMQLFLIFSVSYG